ncbi:hypothetical protein ACFFL1_07565 [Samsonia erythrinae]|uniref:Uncharacterized protein n=1 Tax=Samsonia erythrinae TaxID=160434 RepID=A0A4R3VU91_9GAMM|nr:hypothetical protein [Samsonia erythrinae]TCV07814.1 hypothetical protein EDC54_102386 [Samsonia erythrinae]
MDDLLDKNGYLDFEDSGRIYDFNSPLDINEFFSIKPEELLPPGASPIIDEETGLCIGYIGQSRGGVYDIYDINGKFVTLHELPLESPIFDPLDIILFGFIVGKSLKGASNLFKITTRNGIVKNLSVRLSENIISSLRGRLKIGLSPKSIKFTSATAAHMREPARYVPVHILEKAIRFGKRGKDLKGKSDRILKKYEIKITKTRFNKDKKAYENKEYNLEIVVDESNWTITHYMYK